MTSPFIQMSYVVAKILMEKAHQTCEFNLTLLHTLVNIPNSELNFRSFLARCLLHSYCNYLQLHLVIVNNSFYVVVILGNSCFSCPVFFFFLFLPLLMFFRSFACLYRQAREEMSFDGVTNEADEIWWFRKLFPSYVFFFFLSIFLLLRTVSLHNNFVLCFKE